MNSRNLQTFSEKRLLNMSKKSGLPTAPEKLSAKERVDRAKAKLMGKRIESRKKTPIPEIKEKNPADVAVDEYLGKLDKWKFLTLMTTGSVMVEVAGKKEIKPISAFASKQVDKIVTFAIKSPKNADLFLAGLKTQIIPRSISIGQLSPLAKEMLIEHFGTDPGKLEKLFRKLFASPASAEETIAVVKKIYNSDPNMLDTALEILLEESNETLSKLSSKSLAIFLNKASNSARVEIYKKITDTQKTYLLHSQLKPELKAEIFDNLIKADLDKLDQATLDAIIFYAFTSPDKIKILTAELIKNPKLIKKLSIYGALKLLTESFEKKGMEKLWKLLLANVQANTKMDIIELKKINKKIRDAIIKSGELKIPEEEKITDEAKIEFLKKTAKQKIEAVEGFKIEGRDIKFTVEGVERSFKKSAKFLKELAKPEYDSPLKVKLACYKELLRIIVKDGSIETNIHNLKGNWKESNEALEAQIILITQLFKNLEGKEKPVAETPVKKPVPAKPEPGAALMTPVAPSKTTTKKPTATPTKPKPTVTTVAKKEVKKAKPKEIIAPTKKEAITKTIEKIQSIATVLGKSTEESLSKILGMNASRKVEISTTPEGPGMYPIYVDGQKSNYIVGIFTFPIQTPNKGFKSLFFVRRKDQAGPEIFTSGDEQGLKDELTNAIKSVPNNKILPPEIQAKVIEKLKTIGLTLVLPEGAKLETLTMENIRTLFDSHVKVRTSIKNGTNIHEIVKKLKEVGQRLRKFAKNYLPAKTKIEFSIGTVGPANETIFHTLTWDPNAPTTNGFGVITKTMKFGSKEALIKKITEIKKAQLTPHQQEIFRGQNERREIEIKRENATEKRLERYKQNYKTLAGKKFMIDKRIGKLDGNQIGILWPRFTGYRRVNALLGKSPFNIKERLHARTGAKLIAGENFTNLNDRIDFEDVFNHLKKSPALRDKSIIPMEYLKNYKTFIKKVDELTKNGEDPKLLTAMFKDVLAPAFELMEAMSNLRFTAVSDAEYENLKYAYWSGGERFKDPMEIAKDSIPRDQMKIVKALQALLGYSERPAGAWRRFLGWLGGGKSEMYLADMNGNSFKVDEGMFQRHFSPKAALFMLLEKNGLYTIENGKKKLNGPAILKEVNNMLKRGYIAKALAELTPKGQKPNKEQYIQAIKKIETDLSRCQITNFDDVAELKGKHKMAFQLGFVSMQMERMENQVRKGLDAKIDAGMRLKGKDPSKITEGERIILRKLIRGGLSEKVVAEVHSHLLFAGYIHFDSKGKFQGAGIGRAIKLSDGSSLLIGGGITRKGPTFGIGLNVQVTKLDGGQIDFNTVISVSGVATGFSGTHDVGKGVQLNWFAGVGMSWSNMINLGLSAGVGLDWDQAFVNLSKERSRKRIEKETGWGKTIKEWSGKSPADKMKILRKLPQWKIVQHMMDRFPAHLTQANLLRAYDIHFRNLNAQITKGAENLVPLIPVGVNTGAIVAGALVGGPVGAIVGAIAGIKFRLGTVAIFIPKPSETQRILSLASSNRVEAKVRARLKKLGEQLKAEQLIEVTTQTVKFTETTGVVFNRPGSALGKGLRIGKRQVARLNKFKTTITRGGIEVHNKALKEAEIQLVKTANGRIELKIQNLYNSKNVADKDLELHIDPTLKKLGVIVEKGRIFLEGDIDDLIITRERFMFSHQQGSGRSSIRDVITIRQSSSFEGKQKVTREWLMKNEGSFVEILMGHKDFAVQDGYSAETTKHLNITTMHAGVKTLQEWLKDNHIKKLYAHRPDIFKPGGEKFASKTNIEANKKLKKLEEIKNDITGKGGMHETLKVQTEKEFEKQKLRPEFYEQMRTLYNNKEFFNKFKKVINNADEIYKLLKEQKNVKNLNERELTMAENYLRNLWFVTVYRADGNLWSLRKKGVDKPLRRKLLRAGLWNIRRMDRLSADEIVAKSKGKISKAEAEKVVKAVQKHKNRPLSDKELIRKNKKLIKRIKRFRDYIKKRYIEQFTKTINKLWKTGEKPNAKELVNIFISEIYEKLIEDLSRTKTPPPLLDFRKLKINPIPANSTLLSGTTIERSGKTARAFSNTLSYETTVKDAPQLHEYGFLKGYEKAYSLTSTDADEKQIAKILLEIASPIPKNNKELLKSSFALKILGLGAYRFIAGGENYKAMIEIVKNPDLATSTEAKYAKAMKQFRKLLLDIRAKQHEGKAYVQKVGNYTVTIDMSATTVKSGAFSKCTNASFYVYEGGKADVKGEIKGKRKRRKAKIIGARTESVQVAKSRTDIASISFSIAGGFTHKFSKKPPQGGKYSSGGPGETTPNKVPGSGPGTTTTGASGQSHRVTEGQGSAGGSPSGH